MRTYGSHGGEQQLAQYFGAEPRGNIDELFAFVYSDSECRELFSKRAPHLRTVDLWAKGKKPGSAWRELFSLLVRLPAIQMRLLRLMLQLKPDACVVNGFQGALVAWPAAVLRRKTAWIYVHRITKSRTGSSFLFRLIYWPFHFVAGNSHAVTQSLAPLTRPESLVVLDNGIDWRGFESRAAAGLLSALPFSNGPVLLSVGRLLPHKGQGLLVLAFSAIAGQFPDAQLWIVGDGPEEKALRDLMAASPAADRMHLLGRREDVPAVLARADVFVNASSWEGLSNAVLEGMVAGLPSVVVDAPGVTECHLHGQTGIIVPRNAEALSNAMRELLEDARLRARMGVAAKERVKSRYSMEACRSRYIFLFNTFVRKSLCAES